MFGRRYSDGLHQAIEAKENVKIEQESQTLASITFQNYFRMYEKLAGMTGTAKTEEAEFHEDLRHGRRRRPDQQPMIREDMPDLVYKTEEAKFNAVVEDIVEQHKTGRPVLVGTISIEKSERLSAMLKQRGVPHQVLNAKYHEKEAEIIAQAGRLGAVTIATNMAGRGTDIVLGGNPEFLAREQLRKEGFRRVIAEATDLSPGGGARRRRSGSDGAQRRGERSDARIERRASAFKSCTPVQEETDAERAKVWSSAASTSWAPSATRAAASTTSCGAGPGGKATRARRAFTSRSKTT